jgi:hypothetical protein
MPRLQRQDKHCQDRSATQKSTLAVKPRRLRRVLFARVTRDQSRDAASPGYDDRLCALACLVICSTWFEGEVPARSYPR